MTSRLSQWLPIYILIILALRAVKDQHEIAGSI